MNELASIVMNLVVPRLEQRLLAQALQKLHLNLCASCQQKLLDHFSELAQTLGSKQPSQPASPTPPVPASPK